MKLPRVIVCSLNYNPSKIHEIVSKHVESLLLQDYPNMVIVLIDNGSLEDETRLLKDLSKGKALVVRVRRNLGVAGGYDVCYRMAKAMNADYLFVVNNDVVLKSNNIVSALVNVAQKVYYIGAVGAVLLQWNKNTVDSAGYMVTTWGDYVKLCHGVPANLCFNKPMPITYAHAALSLYSMKALHKAGGCLEMITR